MRLHGDTARWSSKAGRSGRSPRSDALVSCRRPGPMSDSWCNGHGTAAAVAEMHETFHAAADALLRSLFQDAGPDAKDAEKAAKVMLSLIEGIHLHETNRDRRARRARAPDAPPSRGKLSTATSPATATASGSGTRRLKPPAPRAAPGTTRTALERACPLPRDVTAQDRDSAVLRRSAAVPRASVVASSVIRCPHARDRCPGAQAVSQQDVAVCESW
jgi:hypothetical protein